MALAASSPQYPGLTPTAQIEAPADVTYDARATGTAYAPHEAAGATPRGAATATTTPDVSEGYSPAAKQESRATRVEVGRDGRRRLTNDMSSAPKGANDWQE
jgi:hypothetical protein